MAKWPLIMTLTVHGHLVSICYDSDDSLTFVLDVIGLSLISLLGLFLKGCELCSFVLEIQRCQIEFILFDLLRILFVSVLGFSEGLCLPLTGILVFVEVKVVWVLFLGEGMYVESWV